MQHYEHTQKGPWHLLLFLMSAVFLTLGWVNRHDPVAAWMLPPMGLLMFGIGSMLRELTVSDQGDHLLLSFGPLKLIRKRMAYDTMSDVSIGRTTFLDGWGVHASLRGGWVWNIWGFGCVVVRTERGVTYIGTDEPERLAEFLRHACQSADVHRVSVRSYYKSLDVRWLPGAVKKQVRPLGRRTVADHIRPLRHSVPRYVLCETRHAL